MRAAEGTVYQGGSPTPEDRLRKNREPFSGRGASSDPVRLAFVLGLLLGACVDDVLVVGDDRAYRACQEATWVPAPPVGCTPVELDSVSPYGCFDETTATDHAGSWVRISRPAGAASRVSITMLGPACELDGGTCAAGAYVHASGETPCACEIGSTTFVPLSLGVATSVPLDAPDEEILLEPLGARFEIMLCVGP